MEYQSKNKIRDLFLDILKLFSPELCVCCKRKLSEGEQLMCTYCRMDIPLTYEWKEHDNPLYGRLRNSISIEEASSFFVYLRKSNFSNIVINLKFNNQKNIGFQMGLWFGRHLSESEFYDDIDIVVPVPLHLYRKIYRGYNQAEQIARGVGESLSVKVDTSIVKRKKYTSAQAKTKHIKDRFENVEGVFTVVKPQKLPGKHILIIDDVLTTGSTTISMIKEINKIVPDCKVSLAVLSSAK